MRAHQRASAALDALIQLPFRHSHGDAALFKLGRTCGHIAARVKLGYGQIVALEIVDGEHDVRIILIRRRRHERSARCGRCPALGIAYLLKSFYAGVDSRPVLCDDLITLFAVCLFYSLLHIIYGVVNRDDVCDLEERCLQAGVYSLAAQSKVYVDLVAVEVIEL